MQLPGESTLETARRLLQRAAVIGGEKHSKEIEADLFLVQEALADFDQSSKDDEAPRMHNSVESTKTSSDAACCIQAHQEKGTKVVSLIPLLFQDLS